MLETREVLYRPADDPQRELHNLVTVEVMGTWLNKMVDSEPDGPLEPKTGTTKQTHRHLRPSEIDGISAELRWMGTGHFGLLSETVIASDQVSGNVGQARSASVRRQRIARESSDNQGCQSRSPRAYGHVMRTSMKAMPTAMTAWLTSTSQGAAATDSTARIGTACASAAPPGMA